MMCKKLILLTLFLVILGSSSAAFAQPYREEFCITICPPGAGPDDEITVTLYHLGEKVDLSTCNAVEMNFWPIAGGFIDIAYPDNPYSGIPGFEVIDGSLVGVLGPYRYQPYHEWDFFVWGPGIADLGVAYDFLWYPIANPLGVYDMPVTSIPETVENGGDCPTKEGHEFGCQVEGVQVTLRAPETPVETLEDVNLVFQAPGDAYGMQDHNDKVALDTWGCVVQGVNTIDPNNYLQGPFEYSVYWGGTDPNSDDMTLIDPPGAWFPPTPDVNDVQTIVGPNGGTLDPGTTYYWRVDVNDLSDGTSGNFKCIDPNTYIGPVFSYTTWGKAILVEPADGALIDISTNPDPNLVWYGDGYEDTFNLYLYQDVDGNPETDDLSLLTSVIGAGTPWPADPNASVYKYTGGLDISSLYAWRIDEVNSGGVGVGDTWYFSTLECETLEDFEGYINSAALEAAWPGDIIGWATPLLGGDSYEEAGQESMSIQFATVAPAWPGTGWVENTGDFNNKNLRSGGGKALNIAYKVYKDSTGVPDNSGDQIFIELVSNGTPGRVYLNPSDDTSSIESYEWVYFYSALQDYEDAGADPCDVDAIRIGLKATATNPSPSLQFDYLGRCGSQCVPGLMESFYGIKYDLNDDCAVNWGDMEIITENWLTEDYSYLVAEPDAGKLMVHYDFVSVSATVPDLSGNDYDGVIDTNSPDFAVDGIATFDGNEFITVAPGDFNAVQPFNGSYAVVIEFQVPVFDGSRCLFSAAPEVPIDANNWDHAFDMKTNHWLEGEGDIWQRNRGDDGWLGFTEFYPGEGAYDDGWHTVVAGYDPCNGIHLTYLDGAFQSGEWAPELIEPLDRYQTLIGDTVDVNNEDSNPLIGDINDVKIYADVNEAEIRFLGGEAAGIHEVPVEELPNTYVDGDFGDNIINFLDYSEVANEWLEEKLFPDP